MTPRCFVTVAICTRNRAGLLAPTLASIARARVPPSLAWEIIVVDNGSTDGTLATCASFAGQLPLQSVVEPEPGLSHARNRALALAHGDYLFFTDDDVIVDEGWLEAFVDCARRYPSAAAFGGPITPYFPMPPDPDLVSAFPALGVGFCGLDHTRTEGPLPPSLPIWGANMAFRRASIAGLRFDPALGRTPTSQRGGEEQAFVQAIRNRGGVVVWCPAMTLRHYVDPARMTLGYLRAFYIGQGEQSVFLGDAPAVGGATIFGVPRWFLRRTIEVYARYGLARITASRRDALRRLRTCCEYRGMLRAYRRLAANRP